MENSTTVHTYHSSSPESTEYVVTSVDVKVNEFAGITEGWPEEPTEPATLKSKPFRNGPRFGRNESCPCKSGKKFKKCCLRSNQ